MSSHEIHSCGSMPPHNFSWVVAKRLAAMGWPNTSQHLQYVIEQGITHLITLSPESRPPIEDCTGLLWTEIPIKEFGVPSFTQINEFIDICRIHDAKNEAVGIHCRKGKGRTGTMAACYLMYFKNLAPQRAVINVRMQRPGSVETYEQEKIIEQYYDYIRTNVAIK